MPDDVEGLTTKQAAEAVGASYRQLDYWVRRGYLPMVEPTPGSGMHRHWTPDLVRLAGVFARTSDLGIPPAVVAEHLADAAIGPCSFVIRLGDDARLLWERP